MDISLRFSMGVINAGYMNRASLLERLTDKGHVHANNLIQWYYARWNSDQRLRIQSVCYSQTLWMYAYCTVGKCVKDNS